MTGKEDGELLNPLTKVPDGANDFHLGWKRRNRMHVKIEMFVKFAFAGVT